MRDGPDPVDPVLAEAVLEAVRRLAVEARPGAPPPVVRLGSRFDTDVGFDSLAMVELVGRVEQRFGVALPDGVLASAETPRDLLRSIEGAGPRLSRGPLAPAAARPAAPRADVAVPEDAASLVEVLGWHAGEHPDRPHLRILTGGGDHEELTYAALHREARAVAAGLRQRGIPPGAAVAIMLPTGRAYFSVFCGVLVAGCVPVPVYPPARPSGLEEHLRRHARILANAEAVALVTVPEARPLVRLVAPEVPSLRHVVTATDLTATDAAPVAEGTVASGSATALLQYTSGSTGDPKGVVLSHANLLANIRAMAHAGGLSPDDVFVSWLPLYHDMGLIGSWLLSMYVGIPFVVLSPVAFLAAPVRWLRAIHDHGGTVSGGPNFGYELCVRRIADEDLDGLDLSSWRLAFNGAEPVSPTTVTRFAARFGTCGLRPGAITPVYGLAECAVALTVPPIGRGARIDRVAREPLARDGRAVPADDGDATAARFVACGRPMVGHEVRIVDRAGGVLGERREGRVQFRGPSATSGYHRNPAATRRLFAGDWLDSGDLGYLADGELHVTGRVKDVIIRAGRNLHPSELEEVVGEVPGVRKGCVAAFATEDAGSGTERLVVVAETRLTDEEERSRVHRAIVEAAVEVVGTPPDDVTLAPPGAVPKTSSGKIRRSETRARYETGRLDAPRRAVWRQLTGLAASGLVSRLARAARAVPHAAYGVYALALFGLVAAVVWSLVLVLPGVDRRWRVVRRAGHVLLRLAGIRLVVTGREHLPAQGAYVVAANHASNLDALVAALVVPEPAVFPAIHGLAANPVARIFLRRMGAHLVARGDRERGVSDTQTLTEVARSGRVLVFFPEGRRSPRAGLEPFRTGAFVVAADAGVPVVPVALRGTREILPVGRTRPRRGSIEVTVTPPVSTPEPGWEGAVALHRETRAAILRHCGEPDLA